MLEDVLLGHCHGCSFVVGFIFPATEMQEAVDEVQGEFLVEAMAVLWGNCGSGVGADQDLAVMKGDDVRGGGIVEEFAMDTGNIGIADQSDLDFLKVQEGRVCMFGLSLAMREGRDGQLFQPAEARALA